MMSSPLIQTLPVGPLQCNCTILFDEETREALVVDPGDESERILQALAALDARPQSLLHTHGHFDHIGATSDVAGATGATIRLHAADRFLYDSLPEQASFFGLSFAAPRPPDEALPDGEVIAFGRFRIRAIHTPGHTPGSTSFLLEGESPMLFSGDTLFHRSIGRTDLWGGDTEQILASIREKLFTLPAQTPVVCGHGPGTTIGEERKQNPFVRL
jgi:glyoxylase-like metal-dependent hydrolase (beta-lactamase superfamily II)